MQARWCQFGDYPRVCFVSQEGNRLEITASKNPYVQSHPVSTNITFSNPTQMVRKTCAHICEESHGGNEIFLHLKSGIRENYTQDKTAIKFLLDAIDSEHHFDDDTRSAVYECASIVARGTEDFRKVQELCELLRKKDGTISDLRKELNEARSTIRKLRERLREKKHEHSPDDRRDSTRSRRMF